jgi:hypothetical protein
MRIDMTFSLWHRATGLLAIPVFALAADDARQQLILRLNAIADTQLEERARAIDKIQTRADAELRQQQVRTRIRRMIGGLPNARAPLNAKSVGTLEREGFRIEKIIFESLPAEFESSAIDGYAIPVRLVPASSPTSIEFKAKKKQTGASVNISITPFNNHP